MSQRLVRDEGTGPRRQICPLSGAAGPPDHDAGDHFRRILSEMRHIVQEIAGDSPGGAAG